MEEDHNDGQSEGRSEQHEQQSMQPTLGDYGRPSIYDSYSGIRRKLIDDNNFELKPSLISMMQ